MGHVLIDYNFNIEILSKKERAKEMLRDEFHRPLETQNCLFEDLMSKLNHHRHAELKKKPFNTSIV